MPLPPNLREWVPEDDRFVILVASRCNRRCRCKSHRSPLKPETNNQSIVRFRSVKLLDDGKLDGCFEYPSFGDELKAGRKEDFMRPIRDEPTVELRHRVKFPGVARLRAWAANILRMASTLKTTLGLAIQKGTVMSRSTRALGRSTPLKSGSRTPTKSSRSSHRSARRTPRTHPTSRCDEREPLAVSCAGAAFGTDA